MHPEASAYELLSKNILAAHDLSGSMSNLEARVIARKERFAKMTLGTLVKEMKACWLVVDDGREEPDSGDDGDAPADLNEPWMRTHSSHVMDRREYERVIAAMAALVATRNDLVHHFLERFNLWSIAGCDAASQHLAHSYGVIDRHMNELTAWARHMDEARARMSRLLARQEFQDFILQQLADRPTVPTELTGPASPAEDPPDYASVVRWLQEAEGALAIDGWVLLEPAIAFVNQATSRGEFPSRYRCSTWRQVLRRSGVFDIEERALPDRSGTATVYRSKRSTPA